MAKKKAGNAALWVIIILLVVGLAGFGATSFSGRVQSVATVGDTEIGVNEYARAVEAQVRNLSRVTQQELTFQQARMLGADRTALATLISQAAMTNEAGRLGLSAGDKRVSEEILSSPAFQGASGSFDRGLYELTLERSNITVAEFEERVRADLATGLIRSAVGAGLETPGIYTDTLFNFARETRDVTWARLTAEDLPEPLSEPAEADLQTYYDANPADFTRPETKAISYAWLSPDMIVDQIEVEEDQLRALYDGRLDEFVQPERRLVERLVFSSEEDAKAAKARLDAGEVTFDALVLERGLSLANIDLGDVAAEDLGDAAEAVFVLEEPGIVGPLPSELGGPALYRMNGVLAAQETTFEEAREELATEAAADRARRIIGETIPQIEDLLAGGADMALLAERTDMQTGQIDWNIDMFDDIAAYDAFRAAANAATPESFPEVIELDDGGIVTLKVDSVTPPEVIPLHEVRDDVIAGWEQAETEKALAAHAQTLADEIAGGAEMAGIGLSLETDRDLGRDSFVEGTPPEFIERIFGMESGDLTVLSAAGDAWLVRLDDVAAPDPDTEEARQVRERFSNQAAAELSAAVTQAFTGALLAETPPQVDQTALNAVNAQLP